MILLARKKTSTEAGWIVFAVIFSTFSSALIIFLCWWNTRGSSKKSSSTQQQSGSSESRTRSRRSVRYWYYYPEYFGYNGSLESQSEDYASTGTVYHLEQTPNYYIYPPPYPPCPDPPPPPPRPPRTPPHIAVYRTRPVNVMSFLDRTQRAREPPPVAEVTSPEPEGTTSHPEDGSSSSSDSSPNEPPPDGDGPPPSGPSGGPRPDSSAPGSPGVNIIDVHSPKEDGSVISRQDVSEAQANFSRLMSVAGTASDRSAPSQAGSEQSTSVNLSHRSMSRASKASMRESIVNNMTRVPSPKPDSHSQHPASGSEAGSRRQSSVRHPPSVRYVKAPTNTSSKERRGSRVASPQGHTASSSTSSSTIRSASPPPPKNTPNRNSQASRHSSIPSRHSRPSPMPRLSPSPPRSHISHHSLLASRSRHSSPPQSPTPPHHSPIPRSPSRHSRSYSHSQFDGRPASRHSSPPQSLTPPHHSPIPHSPSHSYGRPDSRRSLKSRPGSRVSSMPSSPTVTDFASVSTISHRPGSPRSPDSHGSPAYRSGGFRAALSPQPEEHERKGSRQSSRYSRRSGEKSPSAVSVSVVELLSLEKDLDQDGHGGGEPMSLLEHEEHEEHGEHEERESRRGSEVLVQDEDEQRRSRRSVSRDSQQRRMDLADDEGKSVELEHGHDHHDDQDPESAALQPEPEPQPEPEHVPEDYYRSYSAAAAATITEPLPPSPNLSDHSSNLSPKSPYHPRKYIPIQVPNENRPHQASVCSVSDSTDSGIGGVGEGKGG